MPHRLDSLLTVLDNIVDLDDKNWILDNFGVLEAIFEKVYSLKHRLETTLHSYGRESEEDVIDPNMVDDDPIVKYLHDNPIMEKLNAVLEKLTRIEDKINGTIDPTSSTKQDYIVVGFDGDMLQLQDRLTSPGQPSSLQIIPIVGMGGIGKTTLARNLYDDRLISSHFDARAWVTVSQDYSIRSILLDLLKCINGKLSEEMLQEKNSKLAHTLYQSLYGKRYLVVVDDMWSAEAWDDIKQLFPKENHRSRILLTSRDLNVAKYVDSSCEHHQMHLLNDDHSWQLFQQMTFGNESCPPLLEGIGQKIVSNCGGLPLAIRVTGGLLSVNKNSKDLWDQLARDVSSVAAEKDEHFSKIFTLSYDHLPQQLRPYFLYMAAFPEDHEIRASKLVSLWLAEGLLKPSESKKLEEAAEEYLQALVDRNLLSVGRYMSNGEVKSYIIHDLMRDFCIRKAREEKIFWVINQKLDNIHEGLFRVSVHTSCRIEDVNASSENMSVARTFMCTGHKSHEILPVFSALKMLRVLDVLQVKFIEFPEQVLQLVDLRFLAISATDLPREISRLRNLQTLIAVLSPTIDISVVAVPSELWEIPELTRVELKKTIIRMIDCYYNPGTPVKLQTLSYISLDDLLSSGFLAKIHNIKKLGIVLISELENVNLSHLHNLETLRYVANPCLDPTSLPNIEFPQSIRKLTLRTLTISQSFMSTIGSLPNLQVLEMTTCKFNEDWELNEGEFGSLLYLMLHQVTMVRWNVNDDCDALFSRLKRLVIRQCNALEGIPSSFGDIASLEKIELYEPNPTLVGTIKLFEEEQRDNGNESLQILISQ